eukprot:GHVL01030859.1.p1 GENE.GHVL01030859.1~~GHVL01030859.1.p1  ORF type:complete len:392 (+),score=67.08 GHVL01030859.1:3-1178(+)
MAPKKKEIVETKILLGRPSNNLKIGLVGLPNVGKSTTFNLLAKQQVPAQNRPFCTIDPHEARMNVPDERFKWLIQHYKPKSEISANLTIFDIAGLVPNAHLGEQLGNSFLSHIQSVDGIFHVVRAFRDPDIIHTEGEVNPVRDLQTIADELRFKDQSRMKQLISDAEKICNRGQDKSKKAELEVMKKVAEHLETEWVSTGDWKAAEVEVLNTCALLTAKPVVYLVNMSERDFIRQKNEFLPKIKDWVEKNIPGKVVPFSAEFEMKLAELETDADRAKYIADVGAKATMIDRIIQTGYTALNLIHFFTCGEDEVRCWTIRSNTKAPQAAGTIHTDFERGFICAEIFKYDDLKELQCEMQIRANGKLLQKGKEYVIEDGDIVFFKHNVSGGKK